MKANQKFLEFKQDDNAGVVGFVIGMFLVILLASSLITTIVTESENASSDANVTGATETMIDLWPLLFAIIPVVVIVKVLS